MDESQLPLFDLEHDVRSSCGDTLPCGCPAAVDPEDRCTGWHWAREEWDSRG